MFEDERMTRATTSGTGILLGLIFYLAGLPPLTLVVPAGILFLGLVADPEETHAVWYGMLNVLGLFELPVLNDIERFTYTGKRHYFWFGEVIMAAILAGVIAVPAGLWLAGRAETSLAFTGAAVLFLPLFVFLPKLIRLAMKADADTVVAAFGKNEQTKKVFWTIFLALAGLVLARVVDPVTVQQILGILGAAGI